jgi:hypothetical protein
MLVSMCCSFLLNVVLIVRDTFEVVSKPSPPKIGGIFDNRVQGLPLKPSGIKSRGEAFNRRNTWSISRIKRFVPRPRLGPRGVFETTYKQTPAFDQIVV